MCMQPAAAVAQAISLRGRGNAARAIQRPGAPAGAALSVTLLAIVVNVYTARRDLDRARTEARRRLASGATGDGPSVAAASAVRGQS